MNGSKEIKIRVNKNQQHFNFYHFNFSFYLLLPVILDYLLPFDHC